MLAAGNPSYPYVSASAIPLSTRPSDVPRPLTVEEIHEYPQLFAQASLNAIEAGFDGVEIHGANGYLLDQFTQDISNHRTDEYGGSIENSTRLSLEVIDAVVKAIGAERTGYRVSPWNTYQGAALTLCLLIEFRAYPIPTSRYDNGRPETDIFVPCRRD